MENNELSYRPLRLGNQPAADTQVYIPSEVLEQPRIATLWVTGMPFTAHAALKAGIPVIGYQGMEDQQSDTLKALHPDFVRVLQSRKVHTVVQLFPSNILDPGFTHDNRQDLSRPLFNVYFAVKRFKDLLTAFDRDITLVWCNIRHQLQFEGVITLDELWEKYPEQALKAMRSQRIKNSSLFDQINLTELSLNRLYAHLKLKDAVTFYSYHADRLKQHEFVFKSVCYCHDGDKLEKIEYTDAKLYLRVGSTYYKRIMIRNSHEEYEQVLKPWAVGEIGRDFGKDFVKQIPRYDSFVNKPNNVGEYQRTIISSHNGIVSNLYNIYHPVDWEPRAGQWPVIERFLRHIFEACNLDGESLYEFGLDYLQLSYLNPRQRLPILALVSAERNTGKSTFLDFLKLIYGANMTILDNQRFNPRFTSHFAGKLFVAIDEGHIPLGDKTTKEMIKNMATGKVMWLEGKGSNAEMVDNFTHLLFCSNNERNFMQIDPGENRFAVLKVPSFRSKGIADDPDMLEKMRLEVPAFLNSLQNRQLYYPVKTTRFWFPDHVYQTEALQVVMDRTKSTIEKELENWLSDAFHSYGQIELNYTLDDVTRELNRASEMKFPKSKIKDLLAENYNITPGNSLRYTFYSCDTKGEPIQEKKKGRFCTFFARDWVSEQEYQWLFEKKAKGRNE